jgi:hypothetical protein
LTLQAGSVLYKPANTDSFKAADRVLMEPALIRGDTGATIAMKVCAAGPMDLAVAMR